MFKSSQWFALLSLTLKNAIALLLLPLLLLLILQPLYSPLSGTTRVSGTRRNIHPLTPILISAHHLLGFLVQGADNKGRHTNNPAGCHSIQTNWCPHLHHPTIFIPEARPTTTLIIYPGLGQEPIMMACILIVLIKCFSCNWQSLFASCGYTQYWTSGNLHTASADM